MECVTFFVEVKVFLVEDLEKLCPVVEEVENEVCITEDSSTLETRDLVEVP